jgi:hypothetical protein
MVIVSALRSSMENTKRPLPSLLVHGFKLALRNWPCVIWAYAVNLVFGLLAAVPFASGLTSYLDHSLAAQRIAGTIDVVTLGELGIHLHGSGFFPIVVHTAFWLNLLQLLVLFVVFTGSVFVFITAERPSPFALLQGGVTYFFRFVRAAILAGCCGGVVLGILLGLRAALLEWADASYTGAGMFYCQIFSGFLVLLVGLLIRLWWDLVEAFIVRNAMNGERKVRHALRPAFRALLAHFFRIFGSFLLADVAGFCALGLCLYLWNQLVPAHQVWMAFLLAQTGLFALLASRFWQRGVESALVLGIEPMVEVSAVAIVEPIAAEIEEEAIASPAVIPPLAVIVVPAVTAVPAVEVLGTTSEPTLRDLVLKLQKEPWVTPQAAPPVAPLKPKPKAETEQKEPLPPEGSKPDVESKEKPGEKQP